MEITMISPLIVIASSHCSWCAGYIRRCHRHNIYSFGMDNDRTLTVMEKLSREVRGIVQHKHDITDNDLQRMHYLQAVMKVTFRLHPPLPLLTPRLARKDVQVKG